MPQNPAAGVSAATDAAPSDTEAPPFPADRRTLSLRRAELNPGSVVTLRFTLENARDAVLHVRLSSTAVPWMTILPAEVALGPGDKQPVVISVDGTGARAALKSGGPATAPIQLAYQYLRSPSAAPANPAPVGQGAVFVRLPQSTCPSCQRPLEEDERTGQTPDICPFCFERLRPCPVCGAPNSWVARTCVLDAGHVIRTAPDWPQLGGEPGHSGSLPEQRSALALSRRWSYPNVPPSRREYALAWSGPAGAYGLVAAAAATPEGDAHIYAFDAVTGAPLWDPYPLSAPLYPDRGGVSLESGKLFAADVNGVVTCLDALRGTRLWETRLEGTARVYGSVTPTGGGLLLVTAAADDGAGCLFVLEAETGRVRQKTPLPGPSDTAPAFASGTSLAFAHTDSGDISAVDVMTGTVVWSAHCVAAEDRATGQGFDSAPLVRGGQVFSASATGTVWCHNATTGEEVWRLAVTNAPLAGTPAHDGSLLYLPADDGVHLVSAQTGRAVRRYPSRLPVRSAPIVLGSAVFFGATDGVVYGALPGRTLERLYEAGASGSQIVAAPAFTEGALFVTATNGVLYALNVGE